MAASRRNHDGMVLIEALGVVVLSAMLVALSMRAFVTHTQLTALNSLVIDRMSGVREVQQAFRESLRESVSVAGDAGNFQTSDATLVLRLAQVEGQDRFCVWTQLDDTGRVSRYTFRRGDEGLLEPESIWTYRLPVTNLRFEASEGGRIATMRFSIRRDDGERIAHTALYPVTGACRAIEARP